MSKQDRQAARTPADLERKYNWGEYIYEQNKRNENTDYELKIIKDSLSSHKQNTDKNIDSLSEDVGNVAASVKALDESLDQMEIFRRLTNDGNAQGVHIDGEGNFCVDPGPPGPPGEPGKDGRDGVDLKAYVILNASGATASFDDGADDLPVKSLMVDIDPAQSGSGEPSPTNVRPISGWTDAKLTRSGKNLLPVVVKTTSQNGVTYDCRADGTVHAYGTTIPGERSYVYLDVPKSNIKGGYSYVIGGCPATGSHETYCLGIQWRLNGALEFGNWDNGQGLTAPFVIPEGATDVQLFVRAGWDTTLDVIFEPTIQLADNSSAGFEPYSADIYNISFPAEAGTVYGGTLDVTTGLLTVDRAIETYSESTGFVEHHSNRFYHAGLPSGSNYNRRTESISNEAIYHDVGNVYGPYFGFGTAGVYINKLSEGETIEQFSARLTANPFQICYYLSTSVTYQLTPTEVKTLLGVNNIWADTGDVSVSYRADPTIIYNKLAAAIISSGGAV